MRSHEHDWIWAGEIGFGAGEVIGGQIVGIGKVRRREDGGKLQ
jgi:hypothetical protein